MKAVGNSLLVVLGSCLMLATSAFATTSGGLSNDLPKVGSPYGKSSPTKPGNPTCLAIGLPCSGQPIMVKPSVRPTVPPIKMPDSPYCNGVSVPCGGDHPPVIIGPRPPKHPMPPIKKPDSPFCNGVSVPCSGNHPPVVIGPRPPMPPMPPMPPIKKPDSPFCNGVSVPCGGDKPSVIGDPRLPMPPIVHSPIAKPGFVPGNQSAGKPLPRPTGNCPDSAMCAQPMHSSDGREPGVMLPNGKIEFSKPILIQEIDPANGVLR